MFLVDTGNIRDPRINLAVEEYLLRHVDEPIFLLYLNEPAVVVGRNQNVLEEIDPDYVKAYHIHVIRRLSGGGAVYHDPGNLNFSFIVNGRQDLHNFARFTRPLINALKDWGIGAELRQKSSIFVDDLKISGNAQYAAGSRLLSHGTLLFDAHLPHLRQALRPRPIRIQSKAVQSVRHSVTNIRRWLPPQVKMDGLKQALLQQVFVANRVQIYELRAADWQQIYQISADRYASWAWNIGRSPKFTVQKSQEYPTGKMEAHIEVEKGKIQSLTITGSSFPQLLVAALTSHLVGIRYEQDALVAALQEVDISPYGGELSLRDLLDLLY